MISDNARAGMQQAPARSLFNALGESRINQLNLKLSELNRSDEILKAAVDREYQKKLLNEFGL